MHAIATAFEPYTLEESLRQRGNLHAIHRGNTAEVDLEATGVLAG